MVLLCAAGQHESYEETPCPDEQYSAGTASVSTSRGRSISEFQKRSFNPGNRQGNRKAASNKNLLNQIAKLQNVDETDYDLELHDFLDKNETEIFNELESYKDESRDIVKDRCSVQLHVPAVVLAQLYKTSRLLDLTIAKKESECDKIYNYL